MGVLKDFQFAFSGLMGRKGVNGTEKSIHKGSAGEKEGYHYADYGTEEFIVQKVGMDNSPFGNKECNDGPDPGNKTKNIFHVVFCLVYLAGGYYGIHGKS